MIDIPKMMQSSIQLDRSIADEKHLTLSQDARIKNTLLSLDVELSEVANTSEWFKVWKDHKGKHDDGKTVRETLLIEYVDAIDFFLLFASEKQWVENVDLTEEQFDKLADKSDKLDLTQTYLAIKSMLFSSYVSNRPDNYRHAWHLYLKLGMAGFGFTAEEIEKAFYEKNKINYKRQEKGY
ncbi:Dimeric dUTPase [Pediococcus damnosus]|uniref:Dimeric dUTPase n=2 Tax=Pediococcus damnosus TaxID=51663 RepID=A0AAC9B0L9_9LACO|nr:Dimeric dUTPase [Pediococcus damnosus]AMV62248.1 Dimeric dUTPase [Pediococcus damnosus]AMV65755.1 Dimeric dUTPase [Pediococcus damnosus]AMV67893.1 Dimeric dUTPase [Pediococcus damnosus]AMV70095.1 Dimeric dUTPase [Pediococcus damnosus]